MKRILFSAMALLLGSAAGCGSPGTSNPCSTVTCQMNQFCDGASGTCKTTSACASVTCQAGQVCDGNPTSATSGMCVQETCGASMCAAGTVCNQATVTCVQPGVPALGVQIDRMGRPAVNTALTNPFDAYPNGASAVTTAGKTSVQAAINLNTQSGDTTKDFYNADQNAAMWTATWGGAMANAAGGAIYQSLAVLDGLDGTCGNQFGFNQKVGGNTLADYTFMAQVLAGDALNVDSSKTSCTQYLGAEVAALTAGAMFANDCGGRTLAYDTIDTTYSALAVGALSGVTDGINQPNPPSANFPFFLAPL